jgi:penicillin-binding protein 2
MGYDLPTGKREHPRFKTYKSIPMVVESKHLMLLVKRVLMTPIQLANMMATVANEGYYYTLILSKE